MTLPASMLMPIARSRGPANSSATLPDVEEAAQAVLKGERKAKLKNTMYFHTAGLRFPYKNMHYTMVAGGNAFYEKRGRNWQPLPEEPTVAVASVASPTELRTWRRSGQFAPVDVNFKYWIPTREGVALQIPEVQFGRGLKVVIVPWSAISDLIAPEFLPITG